MTASYALKIAPTFITSQLSKAVPRTRAQPALPEALLVLVDLPPRLFSQNHLNVRILNQPQGAGDLLAPPLENDG